MAYIINSDLCLGCGACAKECPVEAIRPDDGKYAINQSRCLDCGTCEAICPVNAIEEN